MDVTVLGYVAPTFPCARYAQGHGWGRVEGQHRRRSTPSSGRFRWWARVRGSNPSRRLRLFEWFRALRKKTMALRRRQLPKNDAGGVPVVEDDEEAELIESDWLSEVVVDDANEWDAVVDANMSDRPRSRPVDEGTRHHRQIGDQAARGTAEAALRATHPLAGVNTDPAAGDGRSASAPPAENVVDRSAPSNTGAAREAYAREKQAPRDDFERRQWALEESILQRMRASREKIARLQERIDRFPEQMEAIIRELDEHRCAGRHDLVEQLADRGNLLWLEFDVAVSDLSLEEAQLEERLYELERHRSAADLRPPYY
ncbi:hypothetical protein CDCA_CDCA01G0207 [Cyanidium caldarium]|uniref:Uncharacterized protein n=1 Tax=Cyanidium caldarium TaxID=2771 RepID=A0AAV9IPJ8_CYACA|nr:hypothetical protein CDCA_CDCA01G0207 [Cyanidium caldarium]